MSWKCIGLGGHVKNEDREEVVDLLIYSCPHCEGITVATAPETCDEYHISITNYDYCPHCGANI